MTMTAAISLDLSAAPTTAVVSSMLKNDSEFEPEVTALLVHVLQSSERGLFIDVGSNIGYFPLLLAKLNAGRHDPVEIVAHEPLPSLQRLARQLQSANQVSYRLEAVAASDHFGTESFYVSAVSDSSNSLVEGFRKAKDVIPVEVDTLDRLYLQELRTGNYDKVVLMVDVETAEPAVLRGAGAILADFRPLVICEVLAGRTERAISEVLAQHNYHYYRFDGTAWVRETTIRGDKTYRFRDWFFAPSERSDEFGDRLEVPAGPRVSLKLR